jgi:hypothetical protein
MHLSELVLFLSYNASQRVYQVKETSSRFGTQSLSKFRKNDDLGATGKQRMELEVENVKDEQEFSERQYRFLSISLSSHINYLLSFSINPRFISKSVLQDEDLAWY